VSDHLRSGAYKIERENGNYIAVPMKIYTDHLLMLPDSKSQALVMEIEKFWALRQDYEDYGFLHKRGILLSGPAATGKSVCVHQLTEIVADQGGLVFYVDNVFFAVKFLPVARHIERGRPFVVVLEDIDLLIKSDEEGQLLALLDGAFQIDNVVFVGTTNYVDNLDPRLTNRPSRFDRVERFDYPDAASRRYFLGKKGKLSGEKLEAWVSATHGFSFAHMKELIVSVLVLDHMFDEEVARLRIMELSVDAKYKKDKDDDD
jgi:hypothetical protein